MAQPVQSINTDNPTLAEIQAAVARPAGIGFPQYVFNDGAGQPIDNNLVLRTLKGMFAQQGPIDPATNAPRVLPWEGCQSHQCVESALLAIGIPLPPYNQILHGVGQPTHTTADRSAMKTRIGGVKKSVFYTHIKFGISR